MLIGCFFWYLRR